MSITILRAGALAALLTLGAAVIPQASAQSAATPTATTAAGPTRPSYVRPDLDLKWLAADGTVNYPPHDGFAGKPHHKTLRPGVLIDRFGGSGRYFSPKGEPFDARALPSVCAAQIYTVYKVLKPLIVESGKAVPWFDEPGGAMQYETKEPSANLVKEHVIEPVANGGPAPCGG